MLGIDDPLVVLAYTLVLASVLLCVLYSAVNWNRGDDSVSRDDVRWAEEDRRVDDKL